MNEHRCGTWRGECAYVEDVFVGRVERMTTRVESQRRNRRDTGTDEQ